MPPSLEPPSTMEPAAGPSRLAVALVILATMAVHAWTLRLEFQLDDYSILPNVGWVLHLDARPADPAQQLPLDSHYLFRPAAWFIWWAVLQSCGGMALPAVFHGVLLLSHGLAVWLLYRLLRPATGARGALVGGAAFGLLPGGVQALSWIAGAGDHLAILFAIVTALLLRSHRRRGGWIGAAATGVAFLIAILCKETAFALAPLIALAWWTDRTSAPWRRFAGAGIAAAMAVGASMVLRWAVLGTLLPKYAHPLELGPERLKQAWMPFAQWVLPWSRDPAVADLVPLAARACSAIASATAPTVLLAAATTFIGLPIVIACLRAPRRAGLPIVALAVGAVIALIPAIGVWNVRATPDNGQSRLLYPLGAAVGAALAVAWSSGTGHMFLRRVVSGCLVLGLLLGLDCEVSIARTEWRVAAKIRARLDSFAAQAAQVAPETRFVILDPEPGYAGLPLIGVGYDHCLQPPFGHLGPRGMAWESRGTLKSCALFGRYPSPMRVLELRGDVLVPLGDPIDGGPDRRPTMVPEGNGWRADPPVTSRVVAMLTVEGAPEPATAKPVCIWKLDRGEFRTTLAPAAAGEPSMWGAPAAETSEGADLTWIFAGQVRAVTFENFRATAPPVLHESMPAVQLLTPPAGSEVTVGEPLRLAFRSAFRPEIFRINIEFVFSGSGRVALIYVVPAKDLLERAPGEFAFESHAGQAVEWPEGSPHVTWEQLSGPFSALSQRTGVTSIPMEIKVDGRSTSEPYTLCRSEPVELKLVGPLRR